MARIELIFSGYPIFAANQSYLPLLASPQSPQSTGDFTGGTQPGPGQLQSAGRPPRLSALQHLEVHQSGDSPHDQRPRPAQQSLRALQRRWPWASCLDVDIQVRSPSPPQVGYQDILTVMDQRGCWKLERLTEEKDLAASCSEELWRRSWSWAWCPVFILRTITRYQRDSLEN